MIVPIAIFFGSILLGVLLFVLAMRWYARKRREG